MKLVPPLLLGTLVLSALVVHLGPQRGRWEVVAVIAFVAIFVSLRVVSKAIGAELERRFNRRG